MFRRWLIPGFFQIAPYDPQQWPDGSICNDFLSMLNVDAHGLHMVQEPENASIPYPFIEVMRVLNRSKPDEWSRDQVLDALRSVAGEKQSYPLTPSTVAECFTKMETALEKYRPFLRPGFDDRFLFEPRKSQD